MATPTESAALSGPIFLLLLLCCCHLATMHILFQSNETYADFRRRLLVGYDPKNSPGEVVSMNKTTIFNNISMHVSSFSSVSVEKMEFVISMYLAQQWSDCRLTYEGINQVSLYGDVTDMIWTPDTYFPQEKEGYRHQLTQRNSFIRIFPNGTVYFVQRIKLVIACSMHLRWFPVDTQVCPLVIESYGHPEREITLRWFKRWDGPGGDAVSFEKGAMHSPEIELDNFTYVNERVSYGGTTDMYSSIKATFTLKRRIGFYIFDAYMPFVSIVTVAWSSCWISVQAVPARASIGVVTVLSIVVHNAGIQRQLPHVSYMKALDLFMIVSLGFVMMALAEFCAAHTLTHFPQRISCCRSRSNSSSSHGSTLTCTCKQVVGNRNGPRFDKYRRANQLDRAMRALFPLSYLLFNVVYWSYLIIHHNHAATLDSVEKEG